MKTFRRTAAAAVVLALMLSVSALAAPESAAASALSRAETAVRASAQAAVGSVGGDWAALGLARAGYADPDYYAAYYAAASVCAAENGGVLSTTRSTEYSRVALAVAAIGRDPRDVGGFDLLAPLSDARMVEKQGINGPVFALLALDSGDWPAADGVREAYVAYILARQLPDGGWAQNGKAPSDPDVTAMALQALAAYSDRADVKSAQSAGLECLSALQLSDGGFATYGTENAESAAQVLCALCALGVPADDARFTKNGVTLTDCVLSWQLQDGRFEHTKGGGADEMASEQCLCALAAVSRAAKGAAGLYDFSDAKDLTAAAPARSADIAVPAQVRPDASFSDTDSEAVLSLARRGIVDGMGGGLFEPGRELTRAQFAAIVVRALGLSPAATGAFSDVPSGAWYAAYVGTAAKYGIVNGVGGGLFLPEGKVTFQEAAAMTARAAALCGTDTAVGAAAAHIALKGSGWGTDVSVWAEPTLAFCLNAGALSGITPGAVRRVTRGEMAIVIDRLLKGTGLY